MGHLHLSVTGCSCLLLWLLLLNVLPFDTATLSPVAGQSTTTVMMTVISTEIITAGRDYCLFDMIVTECWCGFFPVSGMTCTVSFPLLDVTVVILTGSVCSLKLSIATLSVLCVVLTSLSTCPLSPDGPHTLVPIMYHCSHTEHDLLYSRPILHRLIGITCQLQ